VTVYSESYWKRREEADEEREQSPAVEVATSSRTAAPETDVSELWDAEIGEPVQSPGKSYGPVEPPPPTPESEADWSGYAPSSPQAPAAATPPADDTRAQRLKAIERMRSLADAPQDAPTGLRDSDLAAASKRDRQAVQRSNLSEAIAAAFARRPARLQSEPSESASLMQRRAMSEKSAGDALGRKLSAEARIAAALKGEKVGSPDGLTPYQREQLKRADADDDYRKKRDEESAGWRAKTYEQGQQNIAINRDLAESQRDFNRRMGTAQFAQRQDEQKYKRERDVQEDAKDLAKAVGGDPAHLSGLLDRLDAAASKPDVPGVGMADRMVPDWAATPEALQARNDMREAVRAMLTMKSGKTVTPQEAQDYARIYGIDGSEEAYRQGVRRLRADISDTVKAKKAGYTPAAVQKFEEAGGTATPPKPPPPVAPDTGTPPKGVIPPNAKNVKRLGKGWAYTLPDGTQEIWEP
jgi:hypothetical protein